MAKIYAICCGGDWADASVDHLILPDGMDIEKESELREKWLREEYHPKTRKDDQPQYKSLTDWLKGKGACEPTLDELEEFWEM